MQTDAMPLAPDQGYVHSIETAGTVDGPGLRVVVFLAGCPLRCLYCHNPDTRRPCSGRVMSADDLLAEVSAYKDFMIRTKGGVTVSGGEPLFQQDFVRAFFTRCQAAGLHTALDTSGYLGARVDDGLLAVTDLVLLDVKAFDPDVHKKLTGMPLAPTLDFARRCVALGRRLWIRCVVVPGWTDRLDDYARLADHLLAMGGVEKVEILPFHKMGETKWQAMDLPYELTATQPPAPQLVQSIRDLFAARGFAVA